MILIILGGAFMLGLCIFVHELGHFLMGRAVGIQAELFSIGYGKGVWKKKIGLTTWQITAIPLGGYVKFYGDDYRDPESFKQGGFLNVHPLKRIIPVLGGPLFNLLLGFIVFVIIHSLSGPLAPRISLRDYLPEDTAAYQGGLRNGDLVLKINNADIQSFMDIQKNVAMSGSTPLKFIVSRHGEQKDFTVHPTVGSSGRATIGITQPGEQRIEVLYPNGDLWQYRIMSLFQEVTPPRYMRAVKYLNDGDVILNVQGEPIHSVSDLQRVLGRYHGKKVEVEVKRQMLPWLTPLYTKTVNVIVPSSGEYRVALNDVIDLKYGKSIGSQVLMSTTVHDQRGLAFLKFDGRPPGSFEKLYDRYQQEKSIALEVAGRKYQARIRVEKIGFLGFRPGARIHGEFMPDPESPWYVLKQALGDTWDNIAIYPSFFKKLFIGRMSFIENAVGPVGMFAIAGSIVKVGLRDYLYLIAFISIALMIMNLIPFPIVDGGHIMFFIIEAIMGKPVSPKIMEIVYRIAFSLLMFLGLWIMYKDFMMFFIQK